MVAATYVKFKGKPITVKKIVDAIGKFNETTGDSKLRGGRKFAVWYKGKSYPPKRILAFAADLNVNSFNGGEETHRVFRSLGFRIWYKPAGRLEDAKIDASHELNARENELFSRKWKELRAKDLLKTVNEPGVYVLACTPNKLAGERVTTDDIFYVGVSKYAGVNKRLRQFLDAADGKGGHSAGTRYYKKYRRRGIFRQASFYVAVASYSCEMKKRSRNPNELRKMGIVAALEMFVMARVKRETGCEPQLNLQ